MRIWFAKKNGERSAGGFDYKFFATDNLTAMKIGGAGASKIQRMFGKPSCGFLTFPLNNGSDHKLRFISDYSWHNSQGDPIAKKITWVVNKSDELQISFTSA